MGKKNIKEPVRGTINRDKAKYSRGIIGNLHFNVNHTVWKSVLAQRADKQRAAHAMHLKGCEYLSLSLSLSI